MQPQTFIETIGHFLVNSIPLIILAIIGVSFLIVFHEFGHLIFAKLFNVYAPSFSIGFGPRILQKKIGETTFALSAIPLGGYVELAGSEEETENGQPSAPNPRSFNAKPYWQKLLIMFGGILFNLIFSYVTFTALYMTGAPGIGSTYDENQKPIIQAVHSGTPAEKSQLKAGDILTGVNNKATPNTKSFLEELTPFIGKPVAIDILRNGVLQKVELISESQGEGAQKKPRLGVTWRIEKKAFLEAVKAGFNTTNELASKIFGIFKNIGKERGQLGGPLALIHQVTQFAAQGWKMFFFMLAFISVNLAVFNLLPFPIFDGGQILFFTIEATMKRPLSDKAREAIHYYTWLAVIGLVIFLTFNDILKFFK